LVAGIAQYADAFQQDVGEDFVAVNARHSHALARARNDLREGRKKLLEGFAIELAASDLRSALDALGEILGKIDNERMLDQLFATFCIGK
jgi:tRNA modification GTPase